MHGGGRSQPAVTLGILVGYVAGKPLGLAAEAAEAAADQDMFWEMHDLLLTHQDHLQPRDLLSYATDLGLDTGGFSDHL
ncbi:MAG TPA: hypothetical protein VIJ82_28065, partial [Streptosporangiaceae bacterium]